jgi:hypothetical protein
MIRISGFIFSMVLLPGVVQAIVQNDTIVSSGLRVGVNISRPLFIFAEPSRFGLEMVMDYNLGPDYFAVAEAGFSRRDLDEPVFNLKESGMFMRLGADRNFYKQFNDVIALGARLGISAYSRSAPFIFIESGYWGEFTGGLPSETFIKQWAEVVLVLKTELFSNIFLGWNIRGKVLLFDNGDRHVNDRNIPGFGAGTTNGTASFDFYIYYRIPLKL